MAGTITMNVASMQHPPLVESAGRTSLAIPLGATEQHGPHLPLHTDTVIATELCTRLATHVPDIVVAPAVAYGSSGEHADFTGTLSIGQAALHHVLVELVRSADRFAGVILVSGHGGNRAPLHAATRLLRHEGRHVLPWLPTGPADDSHAGHTETSVMLTLRPTEVDTATAAPGTTESLPELMQQLRDSGVAAISPNGVLGDPTRANPGDGEWILQRWTNTLIAQTTAWRQHRERSLS